MTHWLQEFIKWHPAMAGAIGMAIANAGITTMPSPDEKSSKGYKWLFNFLHVLVLAIPRIVSQYGEKPAPPAS
jgi:hypothetical protein